jgi:hypothetical protein
MQLPDAAVSVCDRSQYRGIAPNMMKALPAISVSYVVYEKVKGSIR